MVSRVFRCYSEDKVQTSPLFIIPALHDSGYLPRLEPKMSLPTNGSCTASPLFQNTVLSYIAAQTDLNTANWWATIADPSRPLAQQLAIAYGDEPTAFKCGIGWINTCTIPSCYRKLHDWV